MLADLRPGQQIADYFVVRNKELRSKKDNEGQYLSLELGDASGRIFGTVWDDIARALPIVEPMTREAFILHFADEIDAKLGAFERICCREREPGKRWSHYVKLMDRFLYFGEEDPPE